MSIVESLDDVLREKSGGFSFDNCARNAALEKMGARPPTMRKTGTTIVGTVFKDGVVVGADSRATAGELIADKHCMKLHKLTDSIYACGAGTAADLDQVCNMVSSNLKLQELNTGRKARVIAALRIGKQHLFRYQGYVGAYLVIGGVDHYGPHLYSCHAHGSTSMDPFMADGSGSLAALGVLERKFKLDMNEEEAIELVKDALVAGIHADLSSGNSLRYCVLRKDGARMFDRVIPDFCVPSVKEMNYRHPPKTSIVLKSKQLKFDVIDTVKQAKAAEAMEH